MDVKTREKILHIANLVISAGENGYDVTLDIDTLGGNTSVHVYDYGRNWDGKSDAVKIIHYYGEGFWLDDMIEYLTSLCKEGDHNVSL